jgi:hypothetical protein
MDGGTDAAPMRWIACQKEMLPTPQQSPPLVHDNSNTDNRADNGVQPAAKQVEDASPLFSCRFDSSFYCPLPPFQKLSSRAVLTVRQ